jgi:hypothetical protein
VVVVVVPVRRENDPLDRFLFRLTNLEVLAGEAQVVAVGAGEGLHFAPGFPGRLPCRDLGRVGHADGAAQVVRVDEVHRVGGNVDDCQWEVYG